jgi:hypothetical protein
LKNTSLSTISPELIPPPAHQILVALGDGEPTLRLAVAVSILVVEVAEELGLLDRRVVRSRCHAAASYARAVTPPRRTLALSRRRVVTRVASSGMSYVPSVRRKPPARSST